MTEKGDLPSAPPRLRANALRVMRLIEYGGPLAPLEFRDTLVECSRRPNHKSCTGLLIVTKQANHQLLAGCPVCGSDEVLIHDWEHTRWAAGQEAPQRIGSLPR